MTTMQNKSCMMHNSASAACADAATFCAYTAGMQSGSIGMIIMGAMIMASIIICCGLIGNVVHLVTLLVVVLLVLVLGVVMNDEKTQRP